MRRLLFLLLPAALSVAIVHPVFNRGTSAGQPAQPAPVAAPAKAKLEYNRDIRPILAENCFACHGPDSAARKADLRIDLRDAAIEAGAIVPGKPEKSELVVRLFAADGDGLMPPVKSHKKLTVAQKETLRRWVAEGAEYQLHWSFLTPVRPEVPAVKDASWVRNPIDNFVLAKLEAKGMKPAPEADRRTLARRLAFDLTGLPPEPADVEAFVADKSEKWYENYVDKLLASPHWGEHRGRYWLDYARYADTHGIHFDNFREVWAYRDWVINAFNKNLPFDQFTIDQLAGDLLPNPTLDQRVATGFNRCNITTNEGGIIDEEYVVLYARDRTETTSAVWMGLTTGCAVCHDHKYDPFSMRDFYAMSAFFNNTTQPTRDGNISNTPPIIPVPKGEDRARFDAISKELADLRSQLDARKAAAKPNFEAWLKTASTGSVLGKNPVAGLKLHAPLTEGEGTQAAFTTDGQVQFARLGTGYGWGAGPKSAKEFHVKPTGDPITMPTIGDFDTTQPFTAAAWVKLNRRNQTGAIFGRMDAANKHRGWDLWIEGDKPGFHLINTFPESAIKIVSRAPVQFNQWAHVAVVYDGKGKAAGATIYINGEPQATTVTQDSLKGTTRTEVPFTIGQRHTDSRLAGSFLKDARVYDRVLTGTEIAQIYSSFATVEALSKPAAQRNASDSEQVFAWWLRSYDEPTRTLGDKASKLQAEEAAIKGRGTIAHVMNEKPGEAGAFLLHRGEYDQRRDPVTAATPKSMPAMTKDMPRNRLGLAQWLLSKDHPLTTRVTVNRFWQEVFGTGLVVTSGDFGVAGELPSHPELLDWLAVEFREKGWDIKQFFRMIVTSATYRQSAVTSPEKLENDRDNRLLSRGPRFRMDAEMIRDNALAASGLLVRKLGGASVKPYQPEGVWEAVAMIGSNTRNYQRDSGENLYRRSMYTFWKRSAPPAAMEVLNAPNRELCTVRRDRTNTPIAALLTLNDVQFVEAARVLAENAIKRAQSDDDRIGFLSARLLARSFKPEELAIVKESLAALRENFKQKPEDAKALIAFGESKADAALDVSELAAWTMLTNQLMNLDEVLNK